MSAISNAVSGLVASGKSISASASNIANMQSTTSVVNGERVNQPYVPQQVMQAASAGGGVQTSLRDVSPPSIPFFLPDDPAANAEGIVQLPNVELTQEVATQLQAVNSYKANLSVIKKENETFSSLMDVLS